jgi:hypothetical protein
VSEPYEWTSRADLDGDAVGVIAAALLEDPEASRAIFEGLDRAGSVALAWVIANWAAHFLGHWRGDGAVGTLRRIAAHVAEGDDT